MTGTAQHRCFLPPRARLNNTMRCPQVLCIISEYLWFTFFYKVPSIPFSHATLCGGCRAMLLRATELACGGKV